MQILSEPKIAKSLFQFSCLPILNDTLFLIQYTPVKTKPKDRRLDNRTQERILMVENPGQSIQDLSQTILVFLLRLLERLA